MARYTDSPHVTIGVDWDIKHQTMQTNKTFTKAASYNLHKSAMFLRYEFLLVGIEIKIFQQCGRYFHFCRC